MPESDEIFRSAISANFLRRRCFSSTERVVGSMVRARRRSSSMIVELVIEELWPESAESELPPLLYGDEAGSMTSEF